MINFEDPADRKKLAQWLVGVVSICILVYLAIRYVSVIAMAVSWLFDLFLPLIMGALIAVALNVPMGIIEGRLFQKKSTPFRDKARRPLAIVVSLLLVIGSVVLVVALIVPEMVRVVGVVVSSFSQYVDQLTAIDDKVNWAIVPFGEELSRIDLDWESLVGELEAWAAQLGSAASAAVGGAIDVIADLALAAVFAIYALFSKERICAQFTRLVRAWLPERVGGEVIRVVGVCYGTFSLFIVGQVIEALILGGLCTLGMLILRLPYAAMIGALVCVTAMIPYIGGLIGGAVGAFMIFSVDPFKALVFLVFLVVLQQIEGNLIYPKVVGGRINLPSVWVFAAVVLGGKLAGPVGMLMSVPVAAAAYTLVREATEGREKRNTSAPAPVKVSS